MQENRNKRLAVLLAVLTAAIVAFAFFGGDDDQSVDKDLYKVADLKEVDRVLIESTSQRSDLKFQGYRWIMNDSIPADRGLVEVLFATLQQAEPKRPVSSSLRDSVSRAIRQSGVKVTLYRGNEIAKIFYAGGDDAKTQAIFQLESSDEPHVMLIPGYRVYVSGIFELPPVSWREKLIFNFQWQNFSRLEARYRNPKGNFDVVMDKRVISIPSVAEVDTAKINTYLDQVSLLTAQQYVDNAAISDSVASEPPIVTISVFDIANRKHELAVFNSGSDFYGKINGKYWAVLVQGRIIPLLRPKDFFVRQ